MSFWTSCLLSRTTALRKGKHNLVWTLWIWGGSEMKPFVNKQIIKGTTKHPASVCLAFDISGCFGYWIWRTSGFLSAFRGFLCLVRIIAQLEVNYSLQDRGLRYTYEAELNISHWKDILNLPMQRLWVCAILRVRSWGEQFLRLEASIQNSKESVWVNVLGEVWYQSYVCKL